MEVVFFAWASLATVAALGFCTLWRVELATRPQQPSSLAAVEETLRAARELSDDEVRVLAETLVFPVPVPRYAWAGTPCGKRNCPETAVVRWLDSGGTSYYSCALHWEYDRKHYNTPGHQTLA